MISNNEIKEMSIMELAKELADEGKKLAQLMREINEPKPTDSPQMKSVKTAFSLINNTSPDSSEVTCDLCGEDSKNKLEKP